MKEESLQRWRKRIERAVALIERRLDDPPSLQELSEAANISPFHLHRVWRSLTGETVRQTIMRLRLEASEQMLEQSRSVTDTALAVGFGTPQSYARAFRRERGITPTQHKAMHEGSTAGAFPPEVVLEHHGDVLVVALRRQGKPYVDLNATFGEVWNWAGRLALLEQLRGIYGIVHDDPASVPVDELRYDACLAVGEFGEPPAPFRRLALPGGEHARLRHQGSYDALEGLTQYLVGEWLPRSGREPAKFPVFHQFLNDPDETPVEDLLTDIHLPLL